MRCVPNQLYFNVENVRTKDDAELTIKLMIFYKMEDINKLLDESHDPIADMINSVTSDIIDFVSKYRFEEFKNHIEKLNDFAIYSQIMRRTEEIGFKISKIVFRGYVASNALETMHNNAIEARTKLVLDQEVEYQAQKMKDFQLQKEKERLEEKLRMEQEEVKNNLHIGTLKLDQSLKNKELESKYLLNLDGLRKQEERNQLKKQSDLELEISEMTKNFELKKQCDYNEEELKRMAKLKELGVNLTEYLIAKEKGAPQKWIKIESNKEGNNQLHLIDKI